MPLTNLSKAEFTFCMSNLLLAVTSFSLLDGSDARAWENKTKTGHKIQNTRLLEASKGSRSFLEAYHHHLLGAEALKASVLRTVGWIVWISGNPEAEKVFIHCWTRLALCQLVWAHLSHHWFWDFGMILILFQSKLQTISDDASELLFFRNTNLTQNTCCYSGCNSFTESQRLSIQFLPDLFYGKIWRRCCCRMQPSCTFKCLVPYENQFGHGYPLICFAENPIDKTHATALWTQNILDFFQDFE